MTSSTFDTAINDLASTGSSGFSSAPNAKSRRTLAAGALFSLALHAVFVGWYLQLGPIDLISLQRQTHKTVEVLIRDPAAQATNPEQSGETPTGANALETRKTDDTSTKSKVHERAALTESQILTKSISSEQNETSEPNRTSLDLSVPPLNTDTVTADKSVNEYEHIFSPNLRKKLSAHKPKNFEQKPASVQTFANIYSEQIVEHNGKCFTVSKGPQPDDPLVWSLPKPCLHLKTQSEKMADGLIASMKQRNLYSN